MRYVNSYQSKDERKAKYNFLRLFGASRKQAMRWRDFTKGHLRSIVFPFLGVDIYDSF